MVQGADEELWPLEAMNYHKNQLRVWSCFTIGSKLDQYIERDDLLKGIHKLFCDRIKLRLNIFKDSSGKLMTREIEGWNDNFVEFLYIDDAKLDLAQIMNNQHKYIFPFSVQRPLWKLVVVNQRWLLFVCDHTLYDGSTVTFMNQELLSGLNDQPIQTDVKVKVKHYNRLIKPGLLLTLQNFLKTFSPDWIKPLVRQLYKPRTKYEGTKEGWILHTNKKLTHQTSKHIISIDSKDFAQLKIILKKQDVQFTSFWVYLNIVALSILKKENIDISVPFNLRKLLPKEYQQYYGLLISHVQLNCKPISNIKDIDWNYVRFINSVFSEVRLTKAAQVIGMLKYISSKNLVISNIPHHRTGVLEVSNLGLIKPVKEGKYGIEEYIFSQPNDITGYYISNSVISSSKKTNITLDGVPEFEIYFQEFVHNLEMLVENSLGGLYDH